MDAIKVLLVDDHALFRAGVSGLLRQAPDFEVVGEARNGEEALAKAAEARPDLILMDIYMPGMGGVEATRRIKEILPSVKIVMLTVSEGQKDLFDAIKAGAQGYLEKGVEPEAFLRILWGSFRGEAPVSGSTAAKILEEFGRIGRASSKEAAPQEEISPREREVLERLGQGATNKEIASALGIAENTVKNHLKNILEKLHLENRVQAATFAVRAGLAGCTAASRNVLALSGQSR